VCAGGGPRVHDVTRSTRCPRGWSP
jgi:hypothetical protein